MVQSIGQKNEQIRDEKDKEAKDLILDIQFDAFGKRFATASCDQKIRVYKRDDNGKYKLETSWSGHSATIWHLDWAHPHHGIILASCSFDKFLRTWMPPAQKNSDLIKRGHSNHQNSSRESIGQEWESTTMESVDRRASVTDVRFSPVWFDPGREKFSEEKKTGEKKFSEGSSDSTQDSTQDKGYSAHCYLACCTLDGTAKVYTNRKSSEVGTEKSKAFLEEKQLQILRNSGNFKCSSLDWSRLRNHDQLIAIGGEGKDQKDKRDNKNNLYVLRYTDLSNNAEPEDSRCNAWQQLNTKLEIDGPVNIVRFAPNAGKHHVLAVGARCAHDGSGSVHVIHITQNGSKFKFEPVTMICQSISFATPEKCWRLAWDSIGSRLYTTHGSRTQVCWTRQYQNDKEKWVGKVHSG